jgi:hypothetical protein
MILPNLGDSSIVLYINLQTTYDFFLHFDLGQIGNPNENPGNPNENPGNPNKNFYSFLIGFPGFLFCFSRHPSIYSLKTDRRL